MSWIRCSKQSVGSPPLIRRYLYFLLLAILTRILATSLGDLKSPNFLVLNIMRIGPQNLHRRLHPTQSAVAIPPYHLPPRNLQYRLKTVSPSFLQIISSVTFASLRGSIILSHLIRMIFTSRLFT